MSKKLKIFVSLSFIVIVTFISIFVGYNYILNKSPIQKPSNNFELDNNINETQEVEIIDAAPKIPKINENTIMVYEYYYKGDNKTDSSSEVAPYFLIDKTEKQLKEIFPNWDIATFELNKVVLRKTVEGNIVEQYVVGVSEGYIAVFHKEPINDNTLKEVTDIPLGVLPLEEQEKLSAGIQVSGEDELAKILEDYGS